MNFAGVLINAGAIAIGGIIGNKFGDKIPDKLGQTLMAGLSLCTIFVGLDGVKLNGNIMVAILSIAIGGVIGELVDFDKRIGNVGIKLQNKLASAKGNFAESFINTSILVCTGAMSIVGSIESGMLGTIDTLLAKSVIDFVIVTVMASTMGIGCAFAGIFALLYEGGLVLFSGFLAPYMTEVIIQQISYVGSILIFGIGLNMLELTRIRLGNLILAPFLPIILYPLITG